MNGNNLLTLDVDYMLGLDGDIPDGLCLHPSQEHIIYSAGTSLIIQSISTKEQQYLEHEVSGAISAITTSNNGKYIAAAFLPYPGFPTIIKVWDFYTRKEIATYESHKDKVFVLKFTKCDTYILSVGGFVEGNNVICYSMNDKEVCCGANASNNTSGDASVLHILSTPNECVFVCGGENALRFWKFHPARKYLEFCDVLLSKYKRKINCIESNQMNTFLYCGTSSGDILKIKIKDNVNEEPVCIENITLLGCFGITALHVLKDNHLIIGCGDGTIELIEEKSVDRISVYDTNFDKLPSPTLPVFVKKNSCNLGSKITTLRMSIESILVSTSALEIIFLDFNFNVNKFIACPTEAINDVIFPRDFSEVFAVATGSHIELRSTDKCNVLLSIKETDSICNGLVFSGEGEQIISVWSNGSIKIFTPETGRLVYKCEKAHNGSITVISLIPGGTSLITGDISGEIRVWSNNKTRLSLITKFRPHKSSITAIHMSPSGNLLLSAGKEGTCVLWNLKDNQQKCIIFSLTVCHSVKFHPNEREIITCGNDKQIKIWSVDGVLLKEIQASRNSVTCMDISSDGRFLMTGGFDAKVWSYDNGKYKLTGIGDSEEISKLQVSPDQCHVITVSSSKRITVWKLPQSL